MGSETHTRTILIVDDDREHCDNLVDILEEEGYQIVTAGTCAEAEAIIPVRRPAIALIDLKLPDGSGTALISRIKEIVPDCVCVIATAYGNLDSAIDALGQGAYQYLQKPLRPRELLSLLARACEMIHLREERARAQQALRVRNAELEDINARLRRMVESSRGLAACSSSGQIGPLLLEEFAHTMAAEGGSLYMCSKAGLALAHHLGADEVPDFIAYPLRGCSVFEHALRTREPLYINDIQKQREVMPSGGTAYRDGSLLVFPLPDDTGGIIAILTLHNKSKPPFTPQDLELGRIFASFSSETLRATRALEALRESEERYRLLAENVDDVIWTADAGMTLTYVSQSVMRLLGYAPEELMQGPPRRALSPVSFTRASDAFTGLITRSEAGQEPGDLTIEIEHLRKDGSAVWSESKVKVVRDASTGRIGLLGVTRDISDRKRAEADRESMYAQLLQAQKMEAIGVLAAGLAHDFNNLLTTIKGYVDLTLLQADEEEPVRVNLMHVHDAAIKAAELTRQLLLFSRKQPMQQNVINLNRSVEIMLKMVRRLLPENITVETGFAPELHSVNADPGSVEQIIMNLVVNARDAMPQGGTITITTGNVDLSQADCRRMPESYPGRFIKLTVSDTGTGMDESTLCHLFEPFYTTKAPGTGTGLGLAVVYGIIVQHKGWIHVESAPGHGSTFTMFLPADTRPAQEDATEASSPASLQGRGETVLLVEDSRELKEFCASVLQQNGYAVIGVENFAEAQRAFKKKGAGIALALIDVVLPDRSGIELAQDLARRSPGLPIVLTSGYTDQQSQWPIIQDSSFCFLQKPFTIVALLQTLYNALGRQA